MQKLPILARTSLIAAALATSSVGTAQSSGSGNLKAAIVDKILRFVDFPSGSNSGPLKLCIKRGADSMTSLSGRSIGSRKISVYSIDPDRGTGDCDVVYLGAASTAEVSKVRGKGVLTIGDGSGFLRAGGAIGLVTTGKQVRFEVSVRSARQSGVSISSQLLRLASKVES